MELKDFSRAIEKNGGIPLLEHAELFRHFCDELDIEALLVDEMGRWLDETRRSPPVVSENTIRLKNFGRFALDLTVSHATCIPPAICSHQAVIQRFCGAGAYELFEIVHHGEVPANIKRVAFGALSEGDVFPIDGSKQVFVALSAVPVAFLSLCEPESAGVRYRFDSASLEMTGTFAASPVSTTIQLATRFLGYYGDEACVPTLRQMLDDPIGAIQWEAACALTRVAQGEGVAAMNRLRLSADRAVAAAADEALHQLVA